MYLETHLTLKIERAFKRFIDIECLIRLENYLSINKPVVRE